MRKKRAIKMWATELRAIDPMDGELKTWGGPMIPGRTIQEAESYLQTNGIGYCRIIGLHVVEISTSSRFDALPPDLIRDIGDLYCTWNN